MDFKDWLIVGSYLGVFGVGGYFGFRWGAWWERKAKATVGALNEVRRA